MSASQFNSDVEKVASTLRAWIENPKVDAIVKARFCEVYAIDAEGHELGRTKLASDNLPLELALEMGNSFRERGISFELKANSWMGDVMFIRRPKKKGLL